MKKQVKWIVPVYMIAIALLVLLKVSHFREVDTVRSHIGDSYDLISGRDEGLRLELEYHRFRSKAAAYVRGVDDVSKEEVLTWFDIFWSRAHGVVSDHDMPSNLDPKQTKALFVNIRNVLKEIDPLVQKLSPGDHQTHGRITARLETIDARITKLATSIAQMRVEQAGNLQRQLNRALEGLDMLLVTSSAGVILVLSLFGIEAYRARTAERKVKIRETRVRYLAEHDSLTGLRNRSYLNQKMKEFIKKSKKSGEEFHLLLLDLDKFKDVNDTFGHPTGDRLLISAAKRVGSILKSDDIVARLGGDEFAVLMKGDKSGIETVVNRLIEALSNTFIIDGHEIHISTSVGVSSFPSLSNSSEELMRDADLALYAAKKDGRSTWQVYKTAMSTEIMHRMGLEADLRQALDQQSGELEVYYQPQVSFDAKGEILPITGVEALARWFHPVHGQIPTMEFIAIAESSGMINDLSKWVTRQACEDVMTWHRAGFEIGVSVNLSPYQLNSSTLPSEIKSLLQETGLSPRYLTLEITESASVCDEGATADMLDQLSELGISLAMDDFGTGFSNLGYLKSLPLDCLKIDRTFVMHIEDNEEDRKLVRGIIQLARGMNMSVVAEGVETEHQVAFLRSLGCTTGQGFLFGRPMNKLKMIRVLDEQYSLKNGMRVIEEIAQHTGTAI